MNEEQKTAQEWVRGMEDPNPARGLFKTGPRGPYVEWNPKMMPAENIILNGTFTSSQLRALADYMDRNNPETAPPWNDQTGWKALEEARNGLQDVVRIARETLGAGEAIDHKLMLACIRESASAAHAKSLVYDDMKEGK